MTLREISRQMDRLARKILGGQAHRDDMVRFRQLQDMRRLKLGLPRFRTYSTGYVGLSS
ncbi:hypothetical protein ACEUZ9_000294 [Paracoccus litorisediminis]|uniref:hypothetical protein n=1 Tax=Paracoccus litorisediminis TaxID=2006130 RepID=UPI003732AC1F